MGILLRVLSRGVTFASIAIISCGVYGLFVGTVLPIATIGKIAGIAFIVGCVLGFGK